MNILLISQCTGNASTETRRILDHFAERSGDKVWQTPITQNGLQELHKLLRKTARKNTAVLCRWIHGHNHSEILWIVGDRTRFNSSGAVPTNTTSIDIIQANRENDWVNNGFTLLVTTLAALLHDFGKSNKAFQAKLHLTQKSIPDAYRHEWVSLCIFSQLVRYSSTQGVTDRIWLQYLYDLSLKTSDKDSTATYKKILQHLINDAKNSTFNYFPDLPPLAKAIAWLILTHHRLPIPKENLNSRSIQLLPTAIKAEWSGTRFENTNLKDCWNIKPEHLPFYSKNWRQKLEKITLKLLNMAEYPNIIDNIQVLHLARASLILGDHVYSGTTATEQRIQGDTSYTLYANTCKINDCKIHHQKLDEHLMGVAKTSASFIWQLPLLQAKLPNLGWRKEFIRRSKDSKFQWQNKAFELAESLAITVEQHGFFGINIASTGCGKTLANARICYALSGEKTRFTIALGLRTLTLQTGDAYRNKLQLDDESIAVLTGNLAIKTLHEYYYSDPEDYTEGNSIFPPDFEVNYDGIITGPLDTMLQKNSKAKHLLYAPVLACTIDHLMPATESLRGGHQIIPMLRLLTSDLILDEPDDFNSEDLYALVRLVYWAGMLGSRILLSTATLPPSLAKGLFDAYMQGRKQLQKNRDIKPEVHCAWFDEFNSKSGLCTDLPDFELKHNNFINKRIQNLAEQPQKRMGKIIDLPNAPASYTDLPSYLAKYLLKSMKELHTKHYTTDTISGKNISCGLIRIANIDPLVDIAQALLKLTLPLDYHLHLCCYHSRFPLLVRSKIENFLDTLLNRKMTDTEFLQQKQIQNILKTSPAKQHIVIVLATAVAEVGRDHDYDWAIVEPSSMRSIIQLAGRVKRHRHTICSEPNLHLLEYNLKGLQKTTPAFTKPGFETAIFKLNSHSLHELLTTEQLQRLDASHRIQDQTSATGDAFTNLSQLEHAHLHQILLGESKQVRSAKEWFAPGATLTGFLQAKTPFRKNHEHKIKYVLLPDAEYTTIFTEIDATGQQKPQANLLTRLLHPENISITLFNSFSYIDILIKMAEDLHLEVPECALRYGAVELPDQPHGWLYHDCLGFRRRR